MVEGSLLFPRPRALAEAKGRRFSEHSGSQKEVHKDFAKVSFKILRM